MTWLATGTPRWTTLPGCSPAETAGVLREAPRASRHLQAALVPAASEVETLRNLPKDKAGPGRRARTEAQTRFQSQQHSGWRSTSTLNPGAAIVSVGRTVLVRPPAVAGAGTEECLEDDEPSGLRAVGLTLLSGVLGGPCCFPGAVQHLRSLCPPGSCLCPQRKETWPVRHLRVTRGAHPWLPSSVLAGFLPALCP